jgi:hypothetical protein
MASDLASARTYRAILAFSNDLHRNFRISDKSLQDYCNSLCHSFRANYSGCRTSALKMDVQLVPIFLPVDTPSDSKNVLYCSENKGIPDSLCRQAD